MLIGNELFTLLDLASYCDVIKKKECIVICFLRFLKPFKILPTGTGTHNIIHG